MDMGSATTTSAAAAATSSMHSSMDMGGDCKISMLWNWYTIDSCFISESWHIRSSSMFAGSCIGVILLVMALEFLRRLGKEYDQYILRQFQRHQYSSLGPSLGPATCSGTSDRKRTSESPRDVSIDRTGDISGSLVRSTLKTATFRPNILQQAVRALIHMVQFAVAYFVMLLAMYYNGYFIICIFIGAGLGAFVFSWESVSMSPNEEVTVCCG